MMVLPSGYCFYCYGDDTPKLGYGECEYCHRNSYRLSVLLLQIDEERNRTDRERMRVERLQLEVRELKALINAG